MSILDQIKAQAKPDELRKIEVPEWGDDKGPFVFWHRMVTMGDMSAAQAVSKDPFRQNVEIICMKALDAEGKPVFQRLDAIELMKVATPIVLLRIEKQMGLLEDIATAEKN